MSQDASAVLPVPEVVYPAEQEVHDAAFPADALYVPTGQSLQALAAVSAVAPTIANFPAGHKLAVSKVQPAFADDGVPK